MEDQPQLSGPARHGFPNGWLSALRVLGRNGPCTIDTRFNTLFKDIFEVMRDRMMMVVRCGSLLVAEKEPAARKPDFSRVNDQSLFIRD